MHCDKLLLYVPRKLMIRMVNTPMPILSRPMQTAAYSGGSTECGTLDHLMFGAARRCDVKSVNMHLLTTLELSAISFTRNFVHFLSGQPNFYQVAQFVDRTRTKWRCFFVRGAAFVLRQTMDIFQLLNPIVNDA